MIMAGINGLKMQSYMNEITNLDQLTTSNISNNWGMRRGGFDDIKPNKQSFSAFLDD